MKQEKVLLVAIQAGRRMAALESSGKDLVLTEGQGAGGHSYLYCALLREDEGPPRDERDLIRFDSDEDLEEVERGIANILSNYL